MFPFQIFCLCKSSLFLILVLGILCPNIQSFTGKRSFTFSLQVDRCIRVLNFVLLSDRVIVILTDGVENIGQLHGCSGQPR